MSLYGLVEALVLMVNALAILNDQRFLSKYGLGSGSIGGGAAAGGFGGGAAVGSTRQKVAGLLHAMSYMRMPLVGLNLFVIVIKLLVG